MTITIRYLDPETDEVKSTRGRVVGVLEQGGPVKHRVAVIDSNHGEIRIPEQRIVDREILEGALTL